MAATAEINRATSEGRPIEEGVLLTKDGTVLLLYPNLREGSAYAVPDGVVRIADYAFFRAQNLTHVAIPEGVMELGWESFRGCSGLQQVTLPDGLESIGGYAFDYCRSLEEIVLPDSVKEVHEYAFRDCESLTAINLPKDVEYIGWGVFENDPYLTVTVFDGSYAHQWCSDNGVKVSVIAPAATPVPTMTPV